MSAPRTRGQGTLPSGWEMRRLLSVVTIGQGQVDPKLEPYRSMVLVAPDHVEAATGRLLAKQTAGEQRAISGKYAFSSGDIVYSKIRPYLRKAILADFDGLCSADMYPLRPVDDVSGGFMLRVLLAHEFSTFAESVSARSGMPKINRAEMAEFSFALPPLPEQRAIAAALSDVDALIAALDQLISKKRDLKTATMQQLLTGQRRLPGFTGAWETRELGEVFTITAGRSKTEFIKDGGRFWIVDMGSVSTTGQLTVSKATDFDGDFLRPGDLVMPKDDIGGGNIIGRTAHIDEDGKYVLGDHVYCLRARAGDPRFLSYVINTHKVNRALRSKVIGSAQLGIGRRSVATQAVPFPPVAEQREIAAVLVDFDGEIAALDARRQKTKLLKQGMMQQLLTGRTRLA